MTTTLSPAVQKAVQDTNPILRAMHSENLDETYHRIEEIRRALKGSPQKTYYKVR